MKKKKRRLRKKRVFGLLGFIIIFTLLIIFLTNIPKSNKLKKIGYNKSDIAIIEKLGKKEINTIKKYKYSKYIIDIINSKEYNKNKIDLYLKYSQKYKDIDYNIIIKLVNENKLDDIVFKLIKEKYYIDEYLDRYINYHNKNKKLSTNEVISNINSNLDYKFYDDAKPADTSKGMHTLVNKYYYLDSNYIPSDIVNATSKYTVYNAKLVKDAYEAFVKMADDARSDNLTIKITTGYRDYSFQKTLYDKYVNEDGVDAADTYSARPGFSEHQLGYSCDLTNGNNVSFDKFENTDEFKWLQNNAYKYGFILRFPKDKDNLTGYMYESWHYRYVGLDVAKYIYENNITFEEYYAYFLR